MRNQKEKEVVIVNTRHVSCDGGQKELGHPKVYLEIKKGIDSIDCPYCGKTFEFKEKK